MATHYEVLGVDPDASAEEIRSAYRRAARAHHPDARGGAGDHMAALNVAWHTLRDPGRRMEYDRTLRPGRAEPAPAPPSPVQPRRNPLGRYQDPPRFPWKPLLVLGAIGAVLALVSSITSSPPEPPAVDNILRNGDCVRIEDNGDASEVLCSVDHDGVVETVVGVPEECPAGSAAHRDRQGLGTACVVDG